jgi:two-component system, OmpR family, phosphate regulon sensor histidine kinase PhoR
MNLQHTANSLKSRHNIMRTGAFYVLPLLLLSVALIALWTVWGRSESIESIYMDQISNSLKIRSALLIPRFKNFIKTSKTHQEFYYFVKTVAEQAETRITLIDQQGNVLCDSENEQMLPNHSSRPEVQMAFKYGFGSSVRYSSTLQQRMLYAALRFTDDNHQTMILRTALSVKSIDAVLLKSRQDIIFTGGIIIVIMICLAYIAVIYVIIPVGKISNSAKQIAAGKLKVRLPVSGRGAIRDLALNLNEMAEQLHGRLDAITREKCQRDAILSSMTEGVIAVDLNEKITNINNAAKKIFAITSGPYEMSVAELFRDNEISKFVKKVIGERITQKQEFALHDVNEKFLMVRATAILDENSVISGILLVLSDITMIKKLENFRQDFVADVSHEIKTPLTIIRGAVETLEDGALDDPDSARKFMKIIIRHVDRLNNLIADILSLSSLDHYQQKKQQFTPCKIADTINTAINLCRTKAEKNSIEICAENLADTKLPGDEGLLEQAIINLIDNALKYSKPNNKIIVKAVKQEDELIISVQDFGCGIAAEHLPRLFERFYRVDRARSRKLGGTGLGLAIVKHIVQLHHGTVEVNSEPSSGSTFIIHLPQA